MEDSDGTSYYYRGNVNNNYVYFAGFYWRIIRINGDGSIRLLYAGTTKDATGVNLFSTLTDSNLGYNNTRKISFNKEKNNPAYSGYMYGNTLNTSYEQTHANEVESEMKKYLDSWYKQNILDKGYNSYVVDNGFCNDRSLSSTSKGDGVQTNQTTYYGGHERWQNNTPSLVCPNEANDLFTLSSNTKGNKKLTYPIGLITVDELMLSGYTGEEINSMAYTYANEQYLTFSPSIFNFNASASSIFALYPNSYLSQYNTSTAYSGVRPVINLASDTEITSGIGTSNEPFIIK